MSQREQRFYMWLKFGSFFAMALKVISLSGLLNLGNQVNEPQKGKTNSDNVNCRITGAEGSANWGFGKSALKSHQFFEKIDMVRSLNE